MKIISSSFITFCVILAIGSAQYISEGPCPTNRPVTEDFDLKRYVATKWYKIYTYKHEFEPGSTCGSTKWNVIDDKSMSYASCNRANGTRSCYTGRLIFLEPEKVPRDGNFLLEFDDGIHKSIPSGITTDYDNYAIGYSCENINGGESSEEYLWVLSSKPVPSPEVKAEIKSILDKYFETNAVKKYKHDEAFECKYELHDED